MGLFIHTRIIPTMASSEWESAWQQTCKILRNYPVPLMALKWVETTDGTRVMYSRQAVVQEDHWRVEGDATSRRMGETFILHRQLEEYRDSTYAPSIFANLDTSRPFIEANGRTIFDSKTQGYPFHEAMLAVAMLLEHRFPNLCHIWGDFSLAQAVRVRGWLCELLDEPVPLPRCLDAARLWNSLEGHGLEGESLVKAFRALFRSEGGTAERWLLAQSRDWGIQLIAGQLTHFNSVSQWGVLDKMRAVLEATGDIEVLLDIIAAANSLHTSKADKDAQPVFFALSAVLKELVQHSVTLPKWQRGAWTQFSQAMQGDLNIEETLGSLFLRMSGVSPAWNVTIDVTDLLAAFVRREPQSAAEFAALLDAETAALGKGNAEFETWLEDHRSELEPSESDNRDGASPDFGLSEGTSFAEYVRANADQQREQPLNLEKSAVKMGEALRKLMATSDLGKILGGETTGAYLHAMARHSTERGPILTEDAWQQIEATTDLSTLRVLCAMMFTCANTATAHLFTRIFLEDSRFWPLLLGH